MSQQPFIPPTYGNIGKSFKDLWSKKFDFKHVLKTVNKTPIGLTLTTTTTFDDSHNGNANVKYVDNTWGDLEAELDTTSGKAYATTNLTKLLSGSKVTVSGGLLGSKKPGDRNFLSAKGAIEYFQDHFTVNGSAVIGEEGGKDSGIVSHLTGAGSVGFEGLSVGGEAKVKVDSNDYQFEDHNIGAQYQSGDITGTVLTEKKGAVIRANAYYKFAKEGTLGAEFVVDDNQPTHQRKLLNVVVQEEIDANTTAKVRWSTSEDLGVALEHRLTNPKLSLLFSASFKTKSFANFRADKFGVGLTFGDY